MKIIFFLLISLISYSLYAECKNKVDATKVVLFVDVNFSAQEIDAARTSACVRGESFVVVPRNTKEIDNLIAEKIKLEKSFGDNNKEKLWAINDRVREASQKQNIQDELKLQLDQMKKSKANLVNLTISGHDGGGFFHGSKGQISKHEIKQIMDDYQDINHVQSALLLGCYTGVKQEVLDWKAIFPNLQMIGGYDGVAPGYDKEAGHQFISEFLNNEKKLLKISNEQNLQDATLSALKSMSGLNAALFIRPTCGIKSDEGYYYGSKTTDGKLIKFSIDCSSKVAEIKEMAALLDKYYAGELEPPKDTTNGELRKLYNKARAVEHCAQTADTTLDINRIFNLLFFKGQKESFSHFYSDDLKTAEGLLQEVTPEKYLKNASDSIAADERDIKNAQNDLELLDKSPDELKAKKQAEIAEETGKYQRMIAGPELKAFCERYPELKTESPFNAYPNVAKEDLEKYNKLKTIKYSLNNSQMIINSIETNPGWYKGTLLNKISSLQMKVMENKKSYEDVKSNPSLLKSAWVPTEENLKNKSRKEILENIANMNKLAVLPGLTDKQRSTLFWLSSVSGQSLNYLSNPFSWHEYTGATVESPPMGVSKLSDFTNLFAPGGILGGGYSGGGMGGYGMSVGMYGQ
jgi:hypothetical protein